MDQTEKLYQFISFITPGVRNTLDENCHILDELGKQGEVSTEKHFRKAVLKISI